MNILYAPGATITEKYNPILDRYTLKTIKYDTNPELCKKYLKAREKIANDPIAYEKDLLSNKKENARKAAKKIHKKRTQHATSTPFMKRRTLIDILDLKARGKDDFDISIRLRIPISVIHKIIEENMVV